MNPTHFGKYLLLDKVGSGGMAEVFLAKQRGIKGFEKVLAIKRILPHLTENPEFVSMFINEAKLAALLSHQNIVQMFELGHVENIYYIAMEYVMGKDLRTVLRESAAKQSPLSIDHMLLIFTKVCAGLDYAHRKKDLEGRELKLVHRDISPQNILVSYEGEVKLVDFGIAKAASQANETRTGMIKGKLSYLSPEQARGKTIDSRTDIFAMGIVLYEMLTGQKLFKGHDEFSTLEKVRNAKIEPLPMKINPEIAPELEAILLKALAKEPENRHQSVAEMQMALEDHMSHRRYDLSLVRFTQSIRKMFSEQIANDSVRFREAEQASVDTPTEDRPTVVRPAVARKPPSPAAAHQTQAAYRKRPSRAGRVFAAARMMVWLSLLLFLAVIWMARVDFPLIYSLRVRSPSAQSYVDTLARLPERLFDRWVQPVLDNRRPATYMTAVVAAAVADPVEPLSAPRPMAAGPVPASPLNELRPRLPMPNMPPRRPISPMDRVEIERLFTQSEADYQAGKLRNVEESLRRIIEIDPRTPRAYHLLGTVLVELKEPAQALKIFEEATRLFPENPLLRYDLGFLYLDFNLASLARTELEKAVQLQSDGPNAEKAKTVLAGLEASLPGADAAVGTAPKEEIGQP